MIDEAASKMLCLIVINAFIAMSMPYDPWMPTRLLAMSRMMVFIGLISVIALGYALLVTWATIPFLILCGVAGGYIVRRKG